MKYMENLFCFVYLNLNVEFDLIHFIVLIMGNLEIYLEFLFMYFKQKVTD